MVLIVATHWTLSAALKKNKLVLSPQHNPIAFSQVQRKTDDFLNVISEVDQRKKTLFFALNNIASARSYDIQLTTVHFVQQKMEIMGRVRSINELSHWLRVFNSHAVGNTKTQLVSIKNMKDSDQMQFHILIFFGKR